MTTEHTCDLPDETPVTVRARWSWSSGTPGTLSDPRGWSLDEFWIVGRPQATLEEREHVRRQLTVPSDRP